jgi:hypothetical protein
MTSTSATRPMPIRCIRWFDDHFTLRSIAARMMGFTLARSSSARLVELTLQAVFHTCQSKRPRGTLQ